MRGLTVAIGAVVVCSALVYAQQQTGVVHIGPGKKAVVGDPRLVHPEFSADTTVFVPNEWPVFIDGKRIDAVNGGHTIVVNRIDGILVDGVLYMPMPVDPPAPQPIKLEDGFFYYVTRRAGELGSDAIKNGASPEEARQIMLDFWAQYSDSVTVVAGEWSASVTYRGDTLGVPFPQPIPENLPPRRAPFQRLLPYAEDLVNTLNRGVLMFWAKGSRNLIQPEDAAQALEDIKRVKADAEVRGYLDGEVVYKGFPLVGGKYKLGIRTVKGLIENQ